MRLLLLTGLYGTIPHILYSTFLSQLKYANIHSVNTPPFDFIIGHSSSANRALRMSESHDCPLLLFDPVLWNKNPTSTNVSNATTFILDTQSPLFSPPGVSGIAAFQSIARTRCRATYIHLPGAGHADLLDDWAIHLLGIAGKDPIHTKTKVIQILSTIKM